MSLKVKQHDITDCGAACLASIASFYGLEIPISRIRQLACTDRQGTNVLGLCHAAEKIGLDVKAVKTIDDSIENKTKPLRGIPLPAIAHVIQNGKTLHFVVLSKIRKNDVTIMDPAVGDFVTMSLDSFLSEWTGVLILCERGSNFHKGNENKSTISRFLELLTPHKKIVTQSVFGALVYTVLGLSTSIYVQKIVDFIIPDGNSNLLNLLSIFMLILLALSLYLNFTKSIFMLKTGIQIDLRLIMGYYKHLLKLPQSFYDNMRSGEIISRVNDAVKIRLFINETLVSLTVNVCTILCAFFLMFTYYWKLAIIILIVIPLYSVIFTTYNKINKRIQRRLMEDAAELEAQLVESINTAGTIKRFDMSDYANLKTESRFVKFIKTSYKSNINGLIAGMSSDIVSRTFTIILLWTGSYFVLRNIITAGELLSFYTLIGYFTGPASSIIGVNRTYQDAKIAADRLFEIMDLDEEVIDDKLNLRRGQIIPDITFEHVSFRYGMRDYVFNDLSIKIKSGEVTAIVGESGCGKSTIAALLQNLYSVESGKIVIGGIDIKHIRNDCLRQIVCVVPQRIDLFEGSVKDNIVLDDYSADMGKILEVSKQVGILDFIEKLPQGFSTNIGENGVQLSGGQRQRIAIARALFRDPEVLILDEATSALDSESENHIKKIVELLRTKGKTIIIIAHRLGTVMTADNILVLKNGDLIEEGKHQHLIQAKGEYYKFWISQGLATA